MSNYDVSKIAHDWRDMVSSLLVLLRDAREIGGRSPSLPDPVLDKSLSDRRNFTSDILGFELKNTVGVLYNRTSSPRRRMPPIVSYLIDKRESDRDIFAIDLEHLNEYLSFAVPNTCNMTGDDEGNAIQRVIFSLACHEFRYQALWRDSTVALRNLEDILKDVSLPFASSAVYMRNILQFRILAVDIFQANEIDISRAQRKKFEEDAFIAEAIGFHYYPLYRDNNFSELARVLKSWLLQ